MLGEAKPKLTVLFFHTKDKVTLQLDKLAQWGARQAQDPLKMKIKSKTVIQQYRLALVAAEAMQKAMPTYDGTNEERTNSQTAQPTPPELLPSAAGVIADAKSGEGAGGKASSKKKRTKGGSAEDAAKSPEPAPARDTGAVGDVPTRLGLPVPSHPIPLSPVRSHPAPCHSSPYHPVPFHPAPAGKVPSHPVLPCPTQLHPAPPPPLLPIHPSQFLDITFFPTQVLTLLPPGTDKAFEASTGFDSSAQMKEKNPKQGEVTEVASRPSSHKQPLSRSRFHISVVHTQLTCY